jgi:cytochrome o ubiquinol oxidase subunit 2
MRPAYQVFIGIAAAGLIAAGTLIAVTHGGGFSVLFPAGSVGVAERDLMLRATELMLIFIGPLAILAVFIAYHYRATNTTATYRPNWEHSKLEEIVWWSIPIEIVLVLGALTWTSTHDLDPNKALAIQGTPVVVEAVALEWKWLFIYPDEGIASVNEVDIPVDRPVEFRITADAPMNSLWIPSLGGQMYAMTGMTTVLHLAADKAGDYAGASANYSGDGFAQMKFTAKALSEADYDAWLAKTKKSGGTLDEAAYNALRAPSDTGAVRYYGLVSKNLFESIVGKFMPTDMSGMHMTGMHR